MADNGTEVQNYDDHKATYDGFISGCIAITLGSFYILVALVICGFASTHYITNLVVGVGGITLQSPGTTHELSPTSANAAAWRSPTFSSEKLSIASLNRR